MAGKNNEITRGKPYTLAAATLRYADAGGVNKTYFSVGFMLMIMRFMTSDEYDIVAIAEKLGLICSYNLKVSQCINHLYIYNQNNREYHGSPATGTHLLNSFEIRS